MCLISGCGLFSWAPFYETWVEDLDAFVLHCVDEYQRELDAPFEDGSDNLKLLRELCEYRWYFEEKPEFGEYLMTDTLSSTDPGVTDRERYEQLQRIFNK